MSSSSRGSQRQWSAGDLNRFVSLANNPLNPLSTVGAEFGLNLKETRQALCNLGHPRGTITSAANSAASTPTQPAARDEGGQFNRHARWTSRDVDTVVNFLQSAKPGSLDKASMDEVAARLGRTRNAVQLHMEKLDLLESYESFIERIFKGRGDGKQTCAWETKSDAPLKFQRWTQEEEGELVKMFASRTRSMSAISKVLGRSSTAIIMHMEVMGLIETRLETARRRAKTFVNPMCEVSNSIGSKRSRSVYE